MMPMPTQHSTPSTGRGKRGRDILEEKEDERERVMREDPEAVLAHRHGLLMAVLQSAVMKSGMLTNDDSFTLLWVSKETGEVVKQNVRAIGGNTKVGAREFQMMWIAVVLEGPHEEVGYSKGSSTYYEA